MANLLIDGNRKNQQKEVWRILQDGAGVYNNGVDVVLALGTDGTVTAWGCDYDGECDVPPGLTNVAAVAAVRGLQLPIEFEG